jgi:energy-converting hydrogenase A subunit R
MKLFPDGGRVFEVISRYDDLLTIEGKKDYEPGDTLALIVPFLVLHGIREADITSSATKATLTGGAAELIAWLKSDGWEVFCITTTYEQYARYITRKLGISTGNVDCTPFPLDKMTVTLCQGDTALLKQVEQDILGMASDDTMIKQRLDNFFWERLPKTELGKLIGKVKPVGGRRKVAALRDFSRRLRQPFAHWVVVGDSITDFRMLKAVDNAGGLAVAFNANRYALPYVTMSLASISISDLAPVLEVWQKEGHAGVEKIVRAKERADGKGDRDNFHWLADKKDIDDVIALHKRIRHLVREEAGKLG